MENKQFQLIISMIWVRYLHRPIINSADTENAHGEHAFIELHLV